MPRLYINSLQLDPKIVAKLNWAFWLALIGLLLAIAALVLWSARWLAG
jgi:hypothetical protein